MVERIYNINLRSAWLKSPRTFRANKSVNTIKNFLTKHMNAKDIKISQTVNELIWIRGAKKPPGSIQVKASKDDEGIVTVMLPDEKIEVKEIKTLKDKILRRFKKREEKKKEKTKEMTEEERKEFEEFRKSKNSGEISAEKEDSTPNKPLEKVSSKERLSKESKPEDEKTENTTYKKPANKKKSK